MEQKDRLFINESTTNHMQKKSSKASESKDSSSIWKPITIGSSSAILFTTVSALIMRKIEERDERDLSVVKRISTSEESEIEKSFKEVFAEARQQRGPNSAFIWKGNVYSTSTKDEWEQMTEAQKEGVVEQIDLSELDIDTINDNIIDENADVYVEQTIGLADEDIVNNDAKDMVDENDLLDSQGEVDEENDETFSVYQEASDNDMALKDENDPSVIVIEEEKDDIDDDVHIISSGEISDVEVLMVINGNENQDVFIVDVDNEDLETINSEVVNADDNQIDISTQYDYVDPNNTEGNEGMDLGDSYFT